MAIIPLIYLMIKKSCRLRTSVHINRKISWNSDRPIRRHISRPTDHKTLEDQEKKKKEEGEQEGVEKGIKISGKKKEELSPVTQLVSGWSVSLLVFQSYLPCGFPVVVWIHVCEFHPWLFKSFHTEMCHLTSFIQLSVMIANNEMCKGIIHRFHLYWQSSWILLIWMLSMLLMPKAENMSLFLLLSFCHVELRHQMNIISIF